jgi:hypothetical protein
MVSLAAPFRWVGNETSAPWRSQPWQASVRSRVFLAWCRGSHKAATEGPPKVSARVPDGPRARPHTFFHSSLVFGAGHIRISATVAAVLPHHAHPASDARRGTHGGARPWVRLRRADSTIRPPPIPGLERHDALDQSRVSRICVATAPGARSDQTLEVRTRGPKESSSVSHWKRSPTLKVSKYPHGR